MFDTFLARLGALSWQRQLLAALGLGLLSALALPPVHAVPVLLLAIPGLLTLVCGQPNWRRAAWIAFAWGWGHGVAGIWWVTEAILKDVEHFWWLVPLAAPVLAVALAAFIVLPVLVARLLPAGWPRVFAFAGAWVLAELARGFVLTGFPWNLIGTVWAFAALPAQGAAIIGVHGLSLATMLLAGVPLLHGRTPWALAALTLAAFAGFGAWRLSLPDPPDQPVQLVLVQGNVAQEVKWQQDQRMPIFRRYLGLTETAAQAAHLAAPHDQLVVIWPETASPFLLTQDPEARRMAAEALPVGARLLGGTVRAEWSPDGRLRQVWNSLAVLDSAGRVQGVYDKSHLVPFGEYMPLAGLIPIRMAAGGMDFSAGPGPVPLAPPGMPPFGALICYEVIFPAAVTPKPRPEWLVNITNDAWFGETSGPWQHLAAARLRAVEEGLPLARAAQTGISAVFDARGRRLAFLPIGATGTLTLPLPGAVAAPLFARSGLVLPGFAALLCMLPGLVKWRLIRRRVLSPHR
ncbi:apolipoprotein N-acyltransferase [Dankookia rubra]|uniref:apolipoprotein N-acyltransferase n=1 Tax=Dankookia rubra TaxID=1442381 RepID=UPI001F4F4ED2|nr:apolipoprotein N-acyltransferase [Dankookia rubra]